MPCVAVIAPLQFCKQKKNTSLTYIFNTYIQFSKDNVIRKSNIFDTIGNVALGGTS